MATPVLIPKLGMTMTEGTVAEWLVPDGTAVKVGDPVYRIETEKIDMEVEAEGSGTVTYVAGLGDTMPCGAVVAMIYAEGEARAAATPAAPAVPSAAPAVVAGAPAAVAAPLRAPGEHIAASPAARRIAQEKGIDLALVPGTGPGGRITELDIMNYQPPEAAPAAPSAPGGGDVLASPLAKKLAEQLGVDLARVKGTGPGGRITKEDVEAAAAAPAPAAPPPASAAPRQPAPAAGGEQLVPIRGIRKVIFQRMHQSLQDMAQLTLAMDVWMDDSVKLRTQLVEEWAPEGVRPSFTDLVILATAKALQKHPRFNSEVRGNELALLGGIHVGMAVAIDDGLVVPVIRNTLSLGLKGLAAESSRVATAARDGKLGPDDYAGGTFAVTALGMFGVDMFTPIINPPNVGILGVGRVRETTAWEGDRPVRRQAMTLSLTWDHRVNDGAPAAEFVRTIKEYLEAPYKLLV